MRLEGNCPDRSGPEGLAMSSLPPLSGAILISNPREDNPMSSALQNPNDRRRINKIARIAVKTGQSPRDLVAMWVQTKKMPKAARPKVFQRDEALATAVRTSQGAVLRSLPKPTKAEAKARSKLLRQARQAAASAFKQIEPEGYGPGYAGRVLGGQGKRYYKSEKKATVTKSVFGKSRRVKVVDPSGIEKWAHSRVSRRAAGEWGHKLPAGVLEWLKGRKRYARGQEIEFSSVHGDAVARAKGGWIPWNDRPKAQKGRAAAATVAAPKKSKGRKASAKNNPLGYGDLALTNGYGDLALENPWFPSAGTFLGSYAAPVTVAGAVAGAAHAALSQKGVTAKISETVAMIPVVGEFASEHLPFTIQGAIVGSILAAGAAALSDRSPEASKYLALAAGGALVFGGGIDAFNAVSESDFLAPSEASDSLGFGDIALENFGDLALTNTSALGDLALTNGGFSAASISSEDYGQACLADAYHSGADFSGPEGQALLNGRDSFRRQYGLPPIRNVSDPTQASHLAGREGHRWGWLVKTVGWDKARQLAALPPKQRVVLIAKLRKAAMASFNQLLVESKARAAEAAAPNAELAGLSGAQGVSGATGATNYLGDPALFMGE